MGDISVHFSRVEFACKCGCGYDTIDSETLQIAEEIRELIGSFTPNSATRCPAHNAAVGGGEKSQHLYARAIDVACKDPLRLYNYLNAEYHDRCGLGLYDTFVHVDTRSKKARWDNRINLKEAAK